MAARMRVDTFVRALVGTATGWEVRGCGGCGRAGRPCSGARTGSAQVLAPSRTAFPSSAQNSARIIPMATGSSGLNRWSRCVETVAVRASHSNTAGQNARKAVRRAHVARSTAVAWRHTRRAATVRARVTLYLAVPPALPAAPPWPRRPTRSPRSDPETLPLASAGGSLPGRSARLPTYPWWNPRAHSEARGRGSVTQRHGDTAKQRATQRHSDTATPRWAETGRDRQRCIISARGTWWRMPPACACASTTLPVASVLASVSSDRAISLHKPKGVVRAIGDLGRCEPLRCTPALVPRRWRTRSGTPQARRPNCPPRHAAQQRGGHGVWSQVC